MTNELAYLQKLDADVLDTLSQEFIIRICCTAIKKLKEKLAPTEVAEILDKLDS